MKYTTEMKMFQEVQGKLDELLDKNGLVGTFDCDSYPIFLSVGQNMDPEEQMALFSVADDGVSARDSRLRLIFKDGDILIRTDSRLIISDDLMGKIKNYAKKLHYLYLQAFHHGLYVGAERTNYGEDAQEVTESAEGTEE